MLQQVQTNNTVWGMEPKSVLEEGSEDHPSCLVSLDDHEYVEIQEVGILMKSYCQRSSI